MESNTNTRLEDIIAILMKCQDSNGLNTCYYCKELLKCKTRSNYVYEVYLGMNKDINNNKKGFEF